MKDILFYYPKGHSAHSEIGHPERPERVEVIKQALEAVDLWHDDRLLYPIDIPTEVLYCVHTAEYLKWLKTTCQNAQHIDMDTYTTPATWDLAHQTAGGAAGIAKAVWNGDSQRGFALTRPPGHHATPKQGMGFCIINNIAVAAEYLLQYEDAKRLAIIDFDLHHGNGTQEIFWKRGDVFYMSTHQSPLYPGTGSVTEIGSGDGEGKNANFPLPPGSGDEAFRSFLNELILPLLYEYKPEMILVSYGFDPHWRDPLGHLQLSAQGYGDLIAGLTKWADTHCEGKIAIFLEGGYDLEAAAACSLSVVYNLLGQKWVDSIGLSPHPEGQSWQGVLKKAKEIWKL